MRRAVFSIPYSLIIGGREFSPDLISSISISKSLSGIGNGGIVTQQLSASVYADFSFLAGESVTVVGFDGLPKFYIDGENRTEDTVNITAYDRCRKLSQPFDYSSLKDGDKVDENGDPIFLDISASGLAEKIAAQCGLSGASNTGDILIGTVSSDVYKGAACNSILENFASASGCFVCCGTDDTLRFQRIGSGYSSASAAHNSAVIVYPQKIFSRLIVSGDKSEFYDFGSGSAENIMEISNSLITQSVASALASRLFENGSFVYQPVSLNAVISGNIDPYGSVIVGEESYKVTNISINLCADGAVASLSAPVVSECSSAYNNLVTRQINQRIAANKIYGNTQISGSGGLEFVADDGVYGFTAFAGGLAQFAGAMMDSVMPDKIEKITNSSGQVERRITYGGKTYALTYKVEGDKKTDIKFVEVTE